MISTTEAMILGMLAQRGRGAYGSELVHASDGKLTRGSVYSLLGMLEKSGWLKSREEAPTEAYALPRTSSRTAGASPSSLSCFGVSVSGFPVSVTTLASKIKAGFASPPVDAGATHIDMLAKVVLRPAATFDTSAFRR